MADPYGRLCAFLLRHRVSRTERILVATSGGSDSMALLRLMLRAGQRVGAMHVHHGLRGRAADADLAFVRQQARAWGVPFFEARVDARRGAGSPEARARALRYAALERVRAACGFGWVATAHTRDDQAETVILRAIRGTAPAGLAAILPVDPDRRLLRPALDVAGSELEAYLRSRGVGWREDASNRDPNVPRSRLRHEVMSRLEEIHPGATANLAALASTALAERSAADARTDAALEAACQPGTGGTVGWWIDPRELEALGPGLCERAWARILLRAGLRERLSRAHLQRIREFVSGPGRAAGRLLSLPGAMVLLSDRGRVWLGPAEGPGEPAAFAHAFAPGADLLVPERDLLLRWRRTPRPVADRPGAEAVFSQVEEPLGCLDPSAGAAALVARSPLPDDCVRRSPRSPARPLDEVLSRARWSRRDRALAVVVAGAGGVVCVVGHSPGLHIAPTRARGPREGGPAEWWLTAVRLSRASPSC